MVLTLHEHSCITALWLIMRKFVNMTELHNVNDVNDFLSAVLIQQTLLAFI